MYQYGMFGMIIRLADCAFIPQSMDNYDYREYLQWVADGGVTLPYDPNFSCPALKAPDVPEEM